MHLSYRISLPLQMCMRNRISPPKDVHKSHIEMTKHSSILSPFLSGINKGSRRNEGKRWRYDQCMTRVARCVQKVAMCNAWLMHGKCTCGARCVKYTTNYPNMFLMRKHEKPQSLVLIKVQTSEKMSKKHFIKHLACTLWTTM